MDVSSFLDLKIPLPTNLEDQLEIAGTLEKAEMQVVALKEMLVKINDEVESVLASVLHATFEK